MKDHYSPWQLRLCFWVRFILLRVILHLQEVPLLYFVKVFSSITLILQTYPVILELLKWPKPSLACNIYNGEIGNPSLFSFSLSFSFSFLLLLPSSSFSFLFHFLYQRKWILCHHSTSLGKRKTFPIFWQGSLSSSRKQIKQNLEDLLLYAVFTLYNEVKCLRNSSYL